ncbi:DUF58 domain-containing protein [Lysinibacillus yapensis]|uniref:DUF58 domain-containing protein n=1 Tax=Ureibacillus yapensis TaxID=2304605 RepID=A0A396S6W4_9BACL|nr:DUF58 domain-containing protein [Lysinibacillus yapensis]RHW32426.1 DUF58 domain-containing protein [Lysinibacillus yapensis]
MRRLKARLRDGGRFIITILLVVSTFSYAMFQGGFVSWFIFYTLMPFLIYSLLLRVAPLRIVEVQREIKPYKLQRGDSAKVRVTFQNKSWFPLIFMTVSETGFDRPVKQQGNSNQIFLVGWKRRFEWTYDLKGLERGLLHFKGLHFTFTDFLGWTIRHKVVEQPKSTVIFPKRTEINYKPIKMQFEHGGVSSPRSMVKDTSLVTGIRDYQSGDKSSWIHWKSFAKNETLRTKDFEEQTTQDILLVIDQTSKRNFENAVDLTASILQSVVKNRGDISFLSTGENRAIFPHIQTQHKLEQVMQHLAQIEPNAKESLASILVNELGRINTASLLLITGELTQELKDFFKTKAKFTSGIICFVVTGENEKIGRLKLPNVTVIPLAAGQFEKAFTEVAKP